MKNNQKTVYKSWGYEEFCRSCGQETLKIERPDGFDSKTGFPRFYLSSKCQNKKCRRGCDGHEFSIFQLFMCIKKCLKCGAEIDCD